MRRAFSILCSRLQKSESDGLKSTIQFLVKGSKRPSWGSLLESETHTDATRDQHVERVLKILNSTLPEVEAQKRRVQSHYDILLSQLKNIASQSSQESSAITDSSEESYNYLLLQQYIGNLQSIPKMAKIILSKNFRAFDKVWENFAMFDARQQLHLSVLLYYRSGNPLIRQKFENLWLEKYSEMHISVQRLLWRCLTKECRTSFEYENIVQAVQTHVKNWTPHDTIVLHQSLYATCHLLPSHWDSLTKNQQLFINTLRIFARYGVHKKEMLRIVKLSIENRLANELSTGSSAISIYQYRFIRALDLAVQDTYSSTGHARKASKHLKSELHEIRASINDEEQEVKSQMSLRFI